MLPTVRLPFRMLGNWAAASVDPVREALCVGPECVGPDGRDTVAPVVPAALDSGDQVSHGQEPMRGVLCRGPSVWDFIGGARLRPPRAHCLKPRVCGHLWSGPCARVLCVGLYVRAAFSGPFGARRG